ncbi:MAG: hypothetical protein ACFE0Q_00165 [Anaerolineae bacterium]
MKEKNLTGIVWAWFGYLAVIVYLANTLGPVAIPFAAIMIAPLVVMMKMVIDSDNKKGAHTEQNLQAFEKRKRQRLDDMIRDMSDEELEELYQRLQNGNIDEDLLYERVVGSDGELMSMPHKRR